MPAHDSRKPAVKERISFIIASKDFADSTSLHGLKFVSRDDAPLAERILWSLVFLTGLLFAIAFSWNLYKAWQDNPVLTTVKTTSYPINSQPFPTVTVCSVNKISTRSLGYWMSTAEAQGFNLAEIRRILEIIATNRVSNENEIQTLSDLMQRKGISVNRYSEFMDSLSPNCTDMLVYCSWEGQEFPCDQYFGDEITDDGVCCSFNSIILSRNATAAALNSNKTLLYGRTVGVYAGLTVILDAETDDYNVTSSASVGFKVSTQDPSDFARTPEIGFLADPGHQIDVSVTGETQQAVDGVDTIDLRMRNCTTDKEITLKYFQGYSGPYCELDCALQLMMKECSCVPFYYPVALPVCDLSSYICVSQVKETLIVNSDACYCPNTCNDMNYQNEISSSAFPNSVTEFPQSLLQRPKFSRLSQEELNSYAKENFVKLNVYFRSITGTSFIMEHRTTWTDYISSCGGLFGLGLGFSLISAFEVLYFLLIRWCFVRILKPLQAGQQRWSPVVKPVQVRLGNQPRQTGDNIWSVVDREINRSNAPRIRWTRTSNQPVDMFLKSNPVN